MNIIIRYIFSSLRILVNEEEIFLCKQNWYGVEIDLLETAQCIGRVFYSLVFPSEQLSHNFWNHLAHNVWCSGETNHCEGFYSGEGIHHLNRFSVTGETTLLSDNICYWRDLSFQCHNTPIRSHGKNTRHFVKI